MMMLMATGTDDSTEVLDNPDPAEPHVNLFWKNIYMGSTFCCRHNGLLFLGMINGSLVAWMADS